MSKLREAAEALLRLIDSECAEFGNASLLNEDDEVRNLRAALAEKPSDVAAELERLAEKFGATPSFECCGNSYRHAARLVRESEGR